MLTTHKAMRHVRLFRKRPNHPQVRIGHVHLKVADLSAIGFYRPGAGVYGDAAAGEAGGVSVRRRVSPITSGSTRGRAAGDGRRGSADDGRHVAIFYPTRAEPGGCAAAAETAGIPLDGAADHGSAKPLYLRDPDERMAWLYWDRPMEMWPRDAAGEVAMYTRGLDVEGLGREGIRD